MAVGEFNAGYEGIRGLYHLDDTADSSGNGFTLTNTGSVTFPIGKFRNGADFGTSNSSKRLTYSATDMGFTNSGVITISVWFYLYSAPGSGAFYTFVTLSTGTDPNNYALYIGYRNDGGTLQPFVNSWGGGAHPYITTNRTLDLFRWYHMVATDDHTTVSVYIDGEPSFTGSSEAGTSSFGPSGVEIGDRAGDQFTSGILDEVAVFKRVFTAAEVKKYYVWAKGRRTVVL